MKNQRIIKLGLIIPDNSEIKDYQITLINSLKKNKKFKIKLIKTDYKKSFNYKKYLFFLEKKFSRNKKYNSDSNLILYNNSIKISIDEIKSYKKKDIDLFINLLGFNISNKLIGIKKPLWEIIYGDEKFQTYPICFNDILNKKPYSKIKVIEIFNNSYKLINEGFFNISNYALLHQEFLFEKTKILLIKSLNLKSKNNIITKKISIKNIIDKNISLFNFAKYFFDNYFLKNTIKYNHNNWKIFISNNKKIFNLNSSKKNFLNIKKTKGYFADPFIFKFRRETYIFFENFNKKENKGHISLINLKYKNKIYDIITKKFHLSYPFIFNFKKNIYLAPETSQKNQLQIWKCYSFPHKWKIFKKKLIGYNFADPTFFVDKKKNLWLFINKSIDKFKDHNSELYIYKVQGNFDKFVPHDLNPVLVDCRIARNAGNLFYYKKKLIKPSQINIHGKYGYGLQFLEITKLSLKKFNYKKIKSLKNIHHLSVHKNLISWDSQAMKDF